MPTLARKKIRCACNRLARDGPAPGPSSSICLFLLGLFSLIAAISCSRPKQEQEKQPEKVRVEINYPDINLKIRRAVGRAGGYEVWVRKRESDSPAHGAPDQPVDVLVVSRAFSRVLRALVASAKEQKLEATIQTSQPRDRLRVAEVQLLKGSEIAGRWRLVETPRILRAAIVIDDLGQDLEAARQLIRLPFPLTFSVLPQLAYSSETAEEAHRAGREVMLHLPMEPEPGSLPLPGPGEITVGMSTADLARVIFSDLRSVPHAAGLNNHMGSRATANAVLMNELMRVLAQRNLFFVDSRTTAWTAALDAARRKGVPAFFRSVFLDDTESVGYSLDQFRRFRQIVERQGVALAIGHPHPTTIKALAEFVPELERDDIQLVYASELVRLPEVAHISPPPRAPTYGESTRLRRAGLAP